MNPFVTDVFGSIARWLLGMLAGYLVQAGILSQEKALEYVAAGSVALVALGWSIWQKRTARTKIVTALATPPMTETQLEAKIANPAIANPAITSAKDEIPKP